MADEEQQDEVNETTEGEKKGGGKFKWIAIGGASIVVIIGLAFLLVTIAFPVSPGGEGAPDEEEETEEEGEIFTHKLGEILVNLNEGRLERILKAEIVLQFKGFEEEAEVIQVVFDHTTEVKDALIDLLSDKELDDMKDKAKLKSEIAATLNVVLFQDQPEEQRGREITSVYFDNFLIQ